MSTWSAFLMLFLPLFTGIRHLAHVLTVPPTKACLLCATPAGLDRYTQAMPVGTYRVQSPGFPKNVYWNSSVAGELLHELNEEGGAGVSAWWMIYKHQLSAVSVTTISLYIFPGSASGPTLLHRFIICVRMCWENKDTEEHTQLFLLKVPKAGLSFEKLGNVA